MNDVFNRDGSGEGTPGHNPSGDSASGGDFSNVYEDDARADSYARLEFPGTYYLAYRDLPALLQRHVRGRRGLDFGCGAGRSTRFASGLGFAMTGADISPQMLARAHRIDPRGDYRLVADGNLEALAGESFDFILSVFTFDNVPTLERKEALFTQLGALLRPGGRIVSLVSAPEIYVHEWASFSTRDFPENREAKSGERVRIVMLDVEDRRPVEDILCSEEDYREVYRRSGLVPVEVHRPLGRTEEPHAWVSETEVAPWTIWVLGRSEDSARTEKPPSGRPG